MHYSAGIGLGDKAVPKRVSHWYNKPGTQIMKQLPIQTYGTPQLWLWLVEYPFSLHDRVLFALRTQGFVTRKFIILNERLA